MKVTGNDEPYTTYYSYDKNNRLVEEEKIYTSDYNEEITEYFYDPNGNMISKAKGKTLLSGNIYCAHCGSYLTSTESKDTSPLILW